MREKITKILDMDFSVDNSKKRKGIVILLGAKEAQSQKAERILSLMEKEIGKMGNPFGGELTLDPEYGAFEVCRQAILNLLHPKDNVVGSVEL